VYTCIQGGPKSDNISYNVIYNKFKFLIYLIFNLIFQLSARTAAQYVGTDVVAHFGLQTFDIKINDFNQKNICTFTPQHF